MEKLVQLCLGMFCLLAPVLLVIITVLVYAMAMGSLKLPGVNRRELQADKDWITVPDLTTKILEVFAAVLSLAGGFFGLLGFLLPWVGVNIGSVAYLFDLGNFNGTLTGIALMFQSIIAGFGLIINMGSDLALVGLGLILFGLIVALIPIAILVTAGIGVGLISVPLGLIKVNTQKLARALLIASIASLCLTCGFFALVQATLGGLQMGGEANILGTSIELGVQVQGGFWVTFFGLLLTLVGAVISLAMVKAMENWARQLAELNPSNP